MEEKIKVFILPLKDDVSEVNTWLKNNSNIVTKSISVQDVILYILYTE